MAMFGVELTGSRETRESVRRYLTRNMARDLEAGVLTDEQLTLLADTMHRIVRARGTYYYALLALTEELLGAEADLMTAGITSLPLPLRPALNDASNLAWAAEATREGHLQAALATHHLSTLVREYVQGRGAARAAAGITETTESTENVNG